MSNTVVLKVEGMSCNNCVKHVTVALEELPGISEIEVNLAEAKVSFRTTGAASEEQIQEAIEDAGYDVVGE
ncbi:MAG: heavy metal-associated domain-containing protein [Pelistega sp.]|nr:heavy metal-associated domain-containing protein [Pelistega sp.]